GLTAFGADAVLNPRHGLDVLPSLSITNVASPKITSLAPLTLGVPNWNDFLTKTGGKSWAVNTPYASPYVSTLRRLTNRSTLPTGDQCGFEYSEGPLRSASSSAASSIGSPSSITTTPITSASISSAS